MAEDVFAEFHTHTHTHSEHSEEAVGMGVMCVLQNVYSVLCSCFCVCVVSCLCSSVIRLFLHDVWDNGSLKGSGSYGAVPL